MSDEPRTYGGALRGPLRDREPVILLDRKGRTYLRTLKRGGRMSVRGAAIACDTVIDGPEGATVASATGERILVLRPTYAQLIPSLPRQAQPIYPKDVGPLLLWGDIAPGHLVVEVGTGPAAVTLALLRAVGLPARYISGYVHPAAEAEVGETTVGESHAWVEFWAGEWVAVDPTSLAEVGSRHVLLASGRDYADVRPLSGVYSGAAAEQFGVTVDVTRLA